MKIAATARETSGVKDMENGSGFDAMAVKEQLREENPELSVQELYAKIQEIKSRGEYTSEVKIKEPKQPEIKKQEPVQETLKPEAVQESPAAVNEAKPEAVQEPPAAAKETAQEVLPTDKMPKSIEDKKKVIKAIQDGTWKGEPMVKIPDELKSKNPKVQEAIDFVRNGSFKNIAELQASDAYKNWSKLVKHCADLLCGAVATDNLDIWTAQGKVTKYSKVVVREAERTLKEQADKMRGLGKSAPKPVVKTTASKEVINNRIAAAKQY